MQKLIIFFLFIYTPVFCQAQGESVRIVFYNTENFFDTIKDSITNDKEFTPDGKRKWNKYKYEEKLKAIYKVIVASGSRTPPEVIGLCEVENENVLLDLIHNTPLNKFKYNIIHYDSPDRRGIDVAIIYQADKLVKISSAQIPVVDAKNPSFHTRDILYASFKTSQEDTLHFFVNHWPSRRGGAERSAAKRILAAQTLHNYIDQNLKISFKCIIMGDFNDTPEDKSIQLVKSNYENGISFRNISTCEGINCGTIKYKGKWDLFDQILISENLFDKLKVEDNSNKYFIIQPSFLLTDDKAYSGKRPKATFHGYQYERGFSDHLPVATELYLFP